MKESNGATYSHKRLADLNLAQIRALRAQSAQPGKRLRVPPLVAGERGDTLQLSYAQEGLWFLDQLGLVGPAYNMSMALKLEGELNVDALDRSLSELIRRHESLRTRFEPVAGSPVQVIGSPGVFALIIQDLSGLQEQDKAVFVQQLSREEAHRTFDLSKGPLLRASLLRVAPREHVLLITMHHIVSDGWSVGIVKKELSALYDAYSVGRSSPLSDLPVQYVDYANWQRRWLQGEVFQTQLDYWRKNLAGAPPELTLPTDRPRPAIESFKGACLTFVLPLTLAGALTKLGRRENVTFFVVLLSAYQVLLSRWSGQEDIIVGSPIAGRTVREVEGLVGCFANALVLRTEVTEDLTCRELLKRVKEVTLGAYAHQDLPFEALVKDLRPNRNLARQPVFQAMLVLQNYPEAQLELPGLKWTWVEVERGSTHFDLTLFLYDTPEGLTGVFEYATDLFDRTTIERLSEHFRILLQGLVENPDCTISRLPMLSETEKQRLLLGLNATHVAYSKDALIHELFEAQVERTPNNVAITYDGQIGRAHV